MNLSTRYMVVFFPVIVFFSCIASQEQNTAAHEMTCRATHVVHLGIASKSELTPEMRSFIFSDIYKQISDPVGQGRMQKAFQEARNVLNLSGFKQGVAIAEAQMALVAVCSYFAFPECKEFAGKQSIPLGGLFDSFQKLDTCGKNYW